MIIRAVCFTERGRHILKHLNEQLNIKCFIKCENAKGDENITVLQESLNEWARSAFDSKDALVFVGSVGIAVRSIAESVKDKLNDSPVIVIDDTARFVIPILSGHVGGANELAADIADIIGAVPVITTSTDNNDAFAVDLFAKENNLRIVDRDNIKRVSAKAIEGKAITLSIKDYPPKEKVDVAVTDEVAGLSTITLAPREYVVGIGLKRGKGLEELEKAVTEVLAENNISQEEVGALATIDIKLEEEGLKALGAKLRIPLLGFDSDILQKAGGEFSASSFVKETVGVDNVCERAAVLAAGQGTIVVRKQARDGITVAVAKR